MSYIAETFTNKAERMSYITETFTNTTERMSYIAQTLMDTAEEMSYIAETLAEYPQGCEHQTELSLYSRETLNLMQETLESLWRPLELNRRTSE